MSAIKTAVLLTKITADGSEVEESYHADETFAVRRLAADCEYCGWLHTGFIGGEAIIYDPQFVNDEMQGFGIIGTAQMRMLGY